MLRGMYKLFIVFIMAAFVTGCASTGGAYKGSTAKAPSRTVLSEMATIDSLQPVEACLAPLVAGKRVFLSGSMDNAGKTNSVSDAGTGNFLPGTQSANFAISTLKRMGVTVQSGNNISGEAALRQNLPPEVVMQRANKLARAIPDYILDVTVMSLDFTSDTNGSLMVKGIGGFSEMHSAVISGGTKLIKGDGTMDIAGYGDMKITVYSQRGGLAVGRIFGNTLVTGEAAVGHQQPMQLWTGEFMVTLSTMKAIADLPHAPAKCGEMLRKIVGPDIVHV